MEDIEHRTVDDEGHVALPKDYRDRAGIECGDDVIVRMEDGKLVIEPIIAGRMAEGYRTRGNRELRLADEFSGVSHAVDDQPADAPDW